MKKGTVSIDLTFNLASSQLDGPMLDSFQASLHELAPQWSSKFHLWRYKKQPLPIDVASVGSLKNVILTKGIEKGALFHQLEKSGPPALYPGRRFGSAELRGANRELIVVLQFDDLVFKPMGSAWIPGNQISVQVRSNSVQNEDAIVWAERCFGHLCATLDPFYGFACASEEYRAKNIFAEGGAVRAIGINIARYLPGLYWLNFFGKPYVEMIGMERILQAPAYRVARISSGCMLETAPRPDEWNRSEYHTVVARVLRHLGEQYFFSRDRESADSISPFDLPVINSTEKVQADVVVDSKGISVRNIKIT